VYNVVAKKVHVCCLISWRVSCFYQKRPDPRFCQKNCCLSDAVCVIIFAPKALGMIWPLYWKCHQHPPTHELAVLFILVILCVIDNGFTEFNNVLHLVAALQQECARSNGWNIHRPAYCFASVIVWTENNKEQRRWNSKPELFYDYIVHVLQNTKVMLNWTDRRTDMTCLTWTLVPIRKKMLPYVTALFVLRWQWNNQRHWRPVFWERWLKKVVSFFELFFASRR